MGLQQSKLERTESKSLERRPSKTKISLNEQSAMSEQLSELFSTVSTLAGIMPASYEDTYEFNVFKQFSFQGHYVDLPQCLRISTSNDTVFVCHDCSVDDGVYLCETCFSAGNHGNHRFSILVRAGGYQRLYCRCGDPEFMKAKTLCENHAKAPNIVKENLDKKQASKFSLYMGEIFKIIYGSPNNHRLTSLLGATIAYLSKITTNNPYYSKMVCEYLLEKNPHNGQTTNMFEFIRISNPTNGNWQSLFRNLSIVAGEYRLPLLRETVHALNSLTVLNPGFFEFLLNFSGRMDWLVKMAKDEGFLLGFTQDKKTKTQIFVPFYSFLIHKTKLDLTEVWKKIVDKNLLSYFCNANRQVIHEILKSFSKNQEYLSAMLEQFIECGDKLHILECMMCLYPEYFVNGAQGGPKKVRQALRSLPQKLVRLFEKFYTQMFTQLNIANGILVYDVNFLLLLPYFGFGEKLIAKLWEELDKRLEILGKFKERNTIRNTSQAMLNFIMQICNQFIKWDHNLIELAYNANISSYFKDKKNIEGMLTEVFDANPKLTRIDLLNCVDKYTLRQRELAREVIKNNLRYNKQKCKYYNVSRVLPNNSLKIDWLNVGSPFKFGDVQEFIAKKIFTPAYFKLLPKLIAYAHKAKTQDLNLAKKISEISSITMLINRNEKKVLKSAVSTFIKDIPDMQDHIFMELASIRDRLQLDYDEDEDGKKGTKKPKLDLIAEIRDKKFQEIKQKRSRLRAKWLKEAEEQNKAKQPKTQKQNVCHICKQKQSQKRRLAFPTNFTRNNAVSVLLKSEVTDLDINICLHKVHEDCFDRNKPCVACSFKANCFIPEKNVAEDSYTKQWLRNFEMIVTTINMESGKSFNSDWATIFLTYLVFSRGFKVLLKNSGEQDKKREKADELITSHFKNQLENWPDLTKNAIKKAEKTVKSQITRQSVTKKVIKTLVLDLVLQEITGDYIKNAKREEKKFRELINTIGTGYAEKINESFEWSHENENIQEVFQTNVANDAPELFRIRDIEEKAVDYIKKTCLKCPECNRFKAATWECLFCSKISCENCRNPHSHCQVEHRGCGIILYLHDAQYRLYFQSRQIAFESIFRNQFFEGWTRSKGPDGWTANTNEIYNFFDAILHSEQVGSPASTRNNFSSFGMNSYMAYANSDDEGEPQDGDGQAPPQRGQDPEDEEEGDDYGEEEQEGSEEGEE